MVKVYIPAQESYTNSVCFPDNYYRLYNMLFRAYAQIWAYSLQKTFQTYLDGTNMSNIACPLFWPTVGGGGGGSGRGKKALQRQQARL